LRNNQPEMKRMVRAGYPNLSSGQYAGIQVFES
jgi:hypothetical protein